MNVLVTGGSGMVGTALMDHLGGYEFSVVDVEEHPDYPTQVASVADYDAIRPAFDGQDAVIHLAVYPPGIEDENWERMRAVNIQGTYNVLDACREAGVPKVIFASTNHVVGMYEEELAPEIYQPDTEFVIDHTTPVRPDSYYAVTKLFGEHLGRFQVEAKSAPDQFYALRICTLFGEEYDHPYGLAERAVDHGEVERGSAEYEILGKRMKAMWFSRRDCAQMVDRMLEDDSISFDIFYGVSANGTRFHDIEHARKHLGYEPRDDGTEWDGPPG